MNRVHLAFLWHQHQPYYKDVLRHRYVLPWVRLHAIKSYTGLLLILKEFPEIHANINVVPSLVAQIEEYASGKAVDHALRLTLKEAVDLTEADRLYMLEHFFAGNTNRAVDPIPRYRELKDRRGYRQRAAADALRDYSLQDYRDLQVWATLAWFHPLVVEADPVLQELRRKGRDFSEEDKIAMLARQDAVIQRVLSLHREAAQSGQVELSTTPYYHPILPLLCNMESAREALPGVPMPDKRSDFQPDAEEQVRRAMELHERVFGRKPEGLWPAEGSVGMDILPLLRGRGLRWIATDEKILSRSSGADLSRDGDGCLLHPDDLYQPYALPEEGLPAIIFRDRGMADAIGFEYHHGDSLHGAENLFWRIKESARRCEGSPRLLSIILDGENPWDYYENCGITFLRELFSRITREPSIVSSCIGDYVREHPPQRKIERLAAGSWIDANFSLWIGKEEDRAAWSLVAEAREALMKRTQENPPLDPQAAKSAWEEIYVAEGSDWYWWLGGDRTSEQDYLFDELFRNHLSNVYHLIGIAPPAILSQPLGKPPKAVARAAGEVRAAWPLADLLGGEMEWTLIGRYEVVSESSTMRPGVEIARRMYYGFGEGEFFVTVETERSPFGGVEELIGPSARLAVHIRTPAPLTFLSDVLSQPQACFRLSREGGAVSEVECIKAPNGVTLRCPQWLLATAPGNQIEFYVEILRGEEVVQRVPNSGGIKVTAPG